ncbi:MAG TPA: hypothetical protein VHW44_13145 [Pseudonocardiaceae bacterium]|nr:hypothetical protein [Pseudonocardiaceae bacterium]
MTTPAGQPGELATPAGFPVGHLAREPLPKQVTATSAGLFAILGVAGQLLPATGIVDAALVLLFQARWLTNPDAPLPLAEPSGIGTARRKVSR